MGNLFCCEGGLLELAYTRNKKYNSVELDAAFLESVVAGTQPDDLVVIIKIQALHNLGAYSNFGDIGPYVEMKLINSGSEIETQRQRTSFKPASSQTTVSWVLCNK